MNAWPLPNTCPTCDRMARVSVCPAACGRRAVELFSRYKNRLNSGTRHQTSPRLNGGGRYQKRVSQLSQLQPARLGQKKPMKSTVSQLSQLSQSKNTPPEADTTIKTARRPCFWWPGGCPAVGPSGGLPCGFVQARCRTSYKFFREVNDER